MNQLTDYLYARPSLVEGVSRLVDVGGTLQAYNASSSAKEADLLAMAADWMAVGDDLRASIDEYRELESKINDKLLSEAFEALQGAEDLI